MAACIIMVAIHLILLKKLLRHPPNPHEFCLTAPRFPLKMNEHSFILREYDLVSMADPLVDLFIRGIGSDRKVNRKGQT